MLKHGDRFWSIDLFEEVEPKNDIVDTVHDYMLKGEKITVIKSRIDGNIYKLGYTAFENANEWKRK